MGIKDTSSQSLWKKSKEMQANSKLKYIAIALVLFVFTYLALEYNKKINIDNYLDQKTTQYTQNYNSIYEEYKRLSEVIFTTTINTPQVQVLFYKRDRKGLYNSLSSTYTLLKQYDIKQLHFHLPNNHSFLRFHRPNKYGDDLTNIRPTVRYVNKERKPIDGFEEGRIYNGYRFVFPMFYKKKYIGSVETSFSTLALSVNFSKDYNIVCNFLISKKTTDKKVFKSEKSNYIPSPFKNFYKEATVTAYIGKIFHAKMHLGVSAHTEQLINSLSKQKKSFSVYDSVKDEIMTFIKVKNPITKKVSGLFIARSDATFIHKRDLTFKIALATLCFGISTLLLFAYRDSRYKESLSSLNQTLENRVQSEVDKNREKDKAMLQQSRLAQMGEMMSMIAHQWRQPLTAISATSGNLTLKAKLDMLDSETAVELGEKISEYSQHLSGTINDFRDFFKPNKKIVDITYKELIQSVLSIIEESINTKNIELKQDLKSEVVLSTYPNELKQVILNLMKNAEDILLDKEIEHPVITIETQDNILKVKDNAGGVPTDIIEKIFDPYFSTKTQKDGTGLGLYMSKTIIEEHCGGELRVYNDQAGAVFEIELPTNNKKALA